MGVYGIFVYPVIETTTPFAHVSLKIGMRGQNGSHVIQNCIALAVRRLDLGAPSVFLFACFTDNFSSVVSVSLD